MKRLTLPTETSDVFEEIITLPFYQEDKVFKYAHHLLTGDNTPSKYQAFVESNPEERELGHYLQFFDHAIDQLKTIEIPQEDYEQWLFNQSDIPTVKEYKQLIHQLYGELNLIIYTEYMGDNFPTVEEDEDNHNRYNPNTTQKYIRLKPYESKEYLRDLDKSKEEINQQSQHNQRKVLNRNNPFADVSIEDQTFLYASDNGGFKTLELNTSYTMTRIQKSEERSYLALQPGFKIRTSSRIDGRTKSDIAFDDTLTTEIAQDDNKVYIYLDAMHE